MTQRHILDIAAFEDPFAILAADANGDGRVSVVDLAELRRLVLGTVDVLENVRPWLFVDADQSFFDSSNPWPFADDIDVLQLSQDMMAENFIGVKIGDVNESYLGAENRSTGVLTLQTENETLIPGQQVEVAVTAQNFDQVAGYQFTLAHEGLVFKGIESGALTVDETNLGIEEDKFSMLWHESVNTNVAETETLFTLTFEATQELELAMTMKLNSSITKAEAYVGQDLETYAIDLVFGNDSAIVTLYQNQPNPFEEMTSIGFDLPTASKASISIFDVAGKELMKINGNYGAGYNTVTVRAEDLEATGVLYYQLQTGDDTVTKKMIVVSK